MRKVLDILRGRKLAKIRSRYNHPTNTVNIVVDSTATIVEEDK